MFKRLVAWGIFLLGGIPILIEWGSRIVSLPGTIENATTWWERWLPMMFSYIEVIDNFLKETLYVELLLLGFLSLIWIYFGDKIKEILKNINKGKLIIVYANECNKDHIQSLFKISTFFLPSGKPIKHRLNFNQFYMGLQNNHTETISNVRCKIEDMNMPPTIIDSSLVWKRNGEKLISIPSKGTEYCLIGKCFDDSDVGMFSPTILPEEQIDKIAHDVQAKAHVGFSIITGDGGEIDLFKNDGYIISFSVYADNVESPAHGIICINAKSRAEVFIYPEGSRAWRTMKRG